MKKFIFKLQRFVEINNLTNDTFITGTDGKDKIRGFNKDATLQITSNTYSTKKSGNNIIVTVDSAVKIIDASARTIDVQIYANKQSNSIVSGSANDSIWGGDDDNFICQAGGGKVVFSGVSADDSFNINGTSYSISGTKLK